MQYIYIFGIVGKTHIIAKFHMTDLIICSHSREENLVLQPNKYGNVHVQAYSLGPTSLQLLPNYLG